MVKRKTGGFEMIVRVSPVSLKYSLTAGNRPAFYVGVGEWFKPTT